MVPTNVTMKNIHEMHRYNQRTSSWRPKALMDFSIPVELLHETAEYLNSVDPPPSALSDLRQLAASHGIVIASIHRSDVDFIKKLSLADPTAMLVDVDKIGMSDIPDIEIIGDFVTFIGANGLRILSILNESVGEKLQFLYTDLKALGFIK